MSVTVRYGWGEDSGCFDLPDLEETDPREGASGALWMKLDAFDERGAWLARLVVESGALPEIAFVGIAPDAVTAPAAAGGYVCWVRLAESGYEFPIRGWRQLVLLVKEIGRRAERRRIGELLREDLAELSVVTEPAPAVDVSEQETTILPLDALRRGEVA